MSNPSASQIIKNLKESYSSIAKDFSKTRQAPWPEFARWMLYDIVDTDIALAYSQMGVELIETADITGLKQFFSEQNS